MDSRAWIFGDEPEATLAGAQKLEGDLAACESHVLVAEPRDPTPSVAKKRRTDKQ